MKRRIKHWLGRATFALGLHRRALRDRAVIVLFHRVDDRYPESGITCGQDQFRRYCRFFARYFDVVPLGEIVGRLERGEPVGGLLAITFDDGYADNRAIAAPELRRHGLPACFFVASDFIGSDHVPFWDAKLSIPSEWMTWDDVRWLRQNGFEIGAHTMRHVDLGQVAGAEAAAEIVGSKEALERETGGPVDLFAYPFGRSDQMTEPNRQVVRESGFRCCVSAFGGTVPTGEDPFRARRMPVSPWFVSPFHLGFEIIASRDRAS